MWSIAVFALLLAQVQSPATRDDRVIASQTEDKIRNLGTGMLAWLYAEYPYDPPVQPYVAEEGAPKPREVRWEECPSISHEALQKLLVPNYMRSIVEKDAWGNKLEYCLDQSFRKDVLALGIRSPGRDGTFESSVYVRGRASAPSFDTDIVWLDGEFLVRPQSSQP